MRHIAAILAALAVATVPVARAQSDAGPLESRLEARKVVVEAGTEKFVDARDAKPGDVIEYVATYRNAGKQPIRDLQATLPIPPETEYLGGTARPAGVRASLDGNAFADAPLKRRVRRGDREAEEPVPLRDYRALRWRLAELAPGKSVTCTARVKVIDDPTPVRKEPPR